MLSSPSHDNVTQVGRPNPSSFKAFKITVHNTKWSCNGIVMLSISLSGQSPCEHVLTAQSLVCLSEWPADNQTGPTISNLPCHVSGPLQTKPQCFITLLWGTIVHQKYAQPALAEIWKLQLVPSGSTQQQGIVGRVSDCLSELSGVIMLYYNRLSATVASYHCWGNKTTIPTAWSWAYANNLIASYPERHTTRAY